MLGSPATAGGINRGGFYLAYFDYIIDDATKAAQAGDQARANLEQLEPRRSRLARL
jgi:hypothetical protein